MSPRGPSDGTPDDVTGPDDQVPDVVAARDDVVRELVRFTGALRAAGADVHATAAVDAARTLVELGFTDRASVRAGLRAVLVGRRSDRPTFDRLFPPFWRRLRAAVGGPGAAGRGDGASEESGPAVGPDGAVDLPSPGRRAAGEQDAVDDRDADEDVGGSVETALRSADDGVLDGAFERLETADYSPVGQSAPVDGPGPADDEDLSAAVERFLATLDGRRGRRWDPGRAGTADVRRALRDSVSTGGTVLEVPERSRRRDAVRTTFLVDVSQSVLDAVDRSFLVGFLSAAFEHGRGARAFFFDTSVRDVSGEFDAPSPTDALAALERAEATWGGGTRIGEAVATVRAEHPDAVDRTTTVVVVSDGLERGDVDDLAAGMAWLSRRADAVLWLNPLATSPDYEPTCRGMAAALPYVDGLFAFAGPDDVGEMTRQLGRRGPGGSVGYEHDPRRRGTGG